MSFSVWRSKAESPEAPAEEPTSASVPDTHPGASAEQHPVSEPPATMPKELSNEEVQEVKQELVHEIVEKILELEDAAVPEITTAPYDPRFPTTNQSRHCFIRYNEFYKCRFENGEDDNKCQFYKHAYESLCPPDWVEEWEELREQGLWMGKY